MKYAVFLFLLFVLPGRSTRAQDDAANTSPSAAETQSVRIVSEVATASRKDFWDKTLVFATLALVGVGIFQIIYLALTVRATRDNATAARLNAEAVIFAERPWLLIPMGKEFSEIDPPLVITRLPGDIRRSFVTFKLKNYGRSPARVTEQKLRLLIGGTEDHIPSITPYQPKDAIEENYTFAQDVTGPIQATIEPDGMISVQEYESLFVRKTHALWLCGYIRYVDTFARPGASVYETRICFRWNHEFTNLLDHDKRHSFWIMAGPREYNRST